VGENIKFTKGQGGKWSKTINANLGLRTNPEKMEDSRLGLSKLKNSRSCLLNIENSRFGLPDEILIGLPFGKW